MVRFEIWLRNACWLRNQALRGCWRSRVALAACCRTLLFQNDGLVPGEYQGPQDFSQDTVTIRDHGFDQR